MTRILAIANRVYVALGLALCRRGRHVELTWLPAHERPVPITNQPLEMLYASGFMALAKWNGWCPRCGRAVMWADRKPSDLPKR